MDENEMQNIINQLPTPFMLLGDFNSHNPIWGSKNINQKGKDLEKLILKHNLCIFNTHTPTYMCPYSGKYSAIDLTLSDPSIFMDFSWSTFDDTCRSDHFPIILESLILEKQSSITINNQQPNYVGKTNPARWSLKKANWEGFKKKCKQLLIETEGIENSIEHFTNTLRTIATEYIPKKQSIYKRNKPWFNKNCQEAIKYRKAALQKFNKNPTTQNLNELKQLKAKRECWKEYVNSLNTHSKTKKIWDMIRNISGKK